jgi:hypothetical protein
MNQNHSAIETLKVSLNRENKLNFGKNRNNRSQSNGSIELAERARTLILDFKPKFRTLLALKGGDNFE